MKVVILGGTGNISSSIVKTLLDNGHEVTCYNRDSAESCQAASGSFEGIARIGRILKKQCRKKALTLRSI